MKLVDLNDEILEGSGADEDEWVNISHPFKKGDNGARHRKIYTRRVPDELRN